MKNPNLQLPGLNLALVLPVVCLIVVLSYTLFAFSNKAVALDAAPDCSRTETKVFRAETGTAINNDNSLITSVGTENIFSANSSYGTCVYGQANKIDTATIPTYDDLKSIYFDQSKSATKSTITNLNSGALTTGGNLFYYNGGLEITSKLEVPNKAVVVFINGNLTLNPNGAGNEEIVTVGSNSSGIVFIVKGDIRVGKNVSKIDAFMITEGVFCSSWDKDESKCSKSDGKQLVINGSVIAINPNNPPSFMRTNGVNASPSEKIIYQPKYIPLMSSVMAKNETYWSEVQ